MVTVRLTILNLFDTKSKAIIAAAHHTACRCCSAFRHMEGFEKVTIRLTTLNLFDTKSKAELPATAGLPTPGQEPSTGYQPLPDISSRRASSHCSLQRLPSYLPLRAVSRSRATSYCRATNAGQQLSTTTASKADVADVNSNEAALLKAMEDLLIMADCQSLPGDALAYSNVDFGYCGTQAWMGSCEATPSPMCRDRSQWISSTSARATSRRSP